jgi:hypothetical protein
MTLEQAIKEIKNQFNKDVVMIEFEDGSGYKFNYRLKGEQKNRFISIKPKTNEFVGLYQQAAEIMAKWTKVVIVFAIISIALTSCSRYYVSGNCNGGSCGVWYPKKFNK